MEIKKITGIDNKWITILEAEKKRIEEQILNDDYREIEKWAHVQFNVSRNFLGGGVQFDGVTIIWSDVHDCQLIYTSYGGILTIIPPIYYSERESKYHAHIQMDFNSKAGCKLEEHYKKEYIDSLTRTPKDYFSRG